MAFSAAWAHCQVACTRFFWLTCSQKEGIYSPNSISKSLSHIFRAEQASLIFRKFRVLSLRKQQHLRCCFVFSCTRFFHSRAFPKKTAAISRAHLVAFCSSTATEKLFQSEDSDESQGICRTEDKYRRKHTYESHSMRTERLQSSFHSLIIKRSRPAMNGIFL